MYRIEFSNIASKELEKIYRLERKMYFRLINVIESLKSDPFQGKKLKGRLKDDYSIRVGIYRIIYTIDKPRIIIYIIDVRHRKEIYR